MSLYTKRDYSRATDEDQNATTKSSSEIFRDRFHEDVGRLVHSQSYRRLARKRQLLPNENSDFVRTRLTHSCEVAQVSTSLGAWINDRPQMKKRELRVNPDILVYAGLAHDIGHPPFGHLGERALNERMWDAGGFEGNAQTLRVLTKLERRFTKGQLSEDVGNGIGMSMYGINSTKRSLASILKYDKAIPVHRPSKIPFRKQAELVKGYYAEENDAVDKIKLALLGEDADAIVASQGGRFKTIEAQIMDYADDVAYSIYDLEDCFRTNVLSPIDFLVADTELLATIGAEMAYKLTVDQFKRGLRTDSVDHTNPTIFGTEGDVTDNVEASEKFQKRKSFNETVLSPEFLSKLTYQLFKSVFPAADIDDIKSSPRSRLTNVSASMLTRLEAMQRNDEFRRKFTEQYIGNCIRNCDIVVNDENPILSTIKVNPLEYLQIEFLKRFNFHKVIKSDLIQSADSRNAQVVREVFDSFYLPGDEFKSKPSKITGYSLLSTEYRLHVDKIFEEHPDNCNDLLRDFESYHQAAPSENATLPTYYRVGYMLNFRSHGFRFELSEAIHKFVRLNDMHEHPMVLAAEARRVHLKRLICDLIANLTDRGLVDLHDRIHREDRRVVIDEHLI